MLGQGALIAVVTLISFYIGLQTSPAVASTMAFATLTLEMCIRDSYLCEVFLTAEQYFNIFMQTATTVETGINHNAFACLLYTSQKPWIKL